MIPDREEALALHERYHSDPVIVEHCLAVAEVADILASGYVRAGRSVDSSVVQAAALLHDIGRSRGHTVRHGLEGARILESEGVDSSVVEAVRKHVGAGISSEEAKTLGFPDHDYIPRTREERIVCFADKMVDSNRVRPFDGEVKRFVKKGHDVPRLLALKKEIEDDLGEDPERLIFDKIKESH
ncbi:MAG TPA: HDIG domain-containing protein [Nitrososphaerales archaeon]|nr:HDIG domain-containing protein [Nitrososphaerales archaeon]